MKEVEFRDRKGVALRQEDFMLEPVHMLYFGRGGDVATHVVDASTLAVLVTNLSVSSRRYRVTLRWAQSVRRTYRAHMRYTQTTLCLRIDRCESKNAAR